MRIESISHLKRRRIKVTLDTGEAMILSEQMLTEAYLYEGKDIDPESLEALMEENRYREALSAALHYAGYQQRTIRDVERRLDREGCDEAVIARVVAWLVDEGYLDDAAYAKEYALQQLRKYGVRRVRHKLMEKGITETVMDRLDLKDDEQVAMALTQKKFGATLGAIDYTLKGKISAYLSGRGFTFETIHKVVNHYEETL